MKILFKSLLIVGLLYSSASLADPIKVSTKQAEKYCNLSIQAKYSHFSKYCKMLGSKKINKEQKIALINNSNEEDTGSFFRQEQIKVESSNFFQGWEELPTKNQKKIKKQKLEVIDLTTYVPNTMISQTQTKDQPYRRQNPTPTPPPEPVRIAREWEGYNTQKNKLDLTKLLSDGNDFKIDPSRIPWCAAFMNAILKESGYEGTNSLMARSFLNYGIKVKAPEEGDIVVFKRGMSPEAGHVAFFVGYEYINNKQYVKALGGNQNKAVTMALYPVEKIIGVRRIL